MKKINKRFNVSTENSKSNKRFVTYIYLEIMSLFD